MRSTIHGHWQTPRYATDRRCRGFELFRRSGAGSFVRVGATGPNETRFSDTGLRAGTSYTYQFSVHT